jgi:hypothetical protein
MSKQPKKSLIIMSVIVLFGLYNLFWYTFVYQRYVALRVGFEQVRRGGYFYLAADDIMYNVVFPRYLFFSGNLVVFEHIEVLNVDGFYEILGDHNLVIWPRIFRETKYGVTLYNEESSRWYGIMLNSNRESIDPEWVGLVEANQEIVDYLFDRAYAMWGNID